MPIDDEEILQALEGGLPEGPVTRAETPANPSDGWYGPHQARPPGRERVEAGRAKRGAILLLLGAAVILFLSVWLGSPGPRDKRSFLAAMAGTAFLAAILGLIGVVFYWISRHDRLGGGGPGEGWPMPPAWVRAVLALMEVLGRLRP